MPGSISSVFGLWGSMKMMVKKTWPANAGDIIDVVYLWIRKVPGGGLATHSCILPENHLDREPRNSPYNES